MSGENDAIFPAAAAEPYKPDWKTLEYHLLDTGHFALEEDGDRIALRMRSSSASMLPTVGRGRSIDGWRGER